MLYLSQRIGHSMWLTFKTKVARNHEKQGHTKPTESLHHYPQTPWKLAVHKHHEDAGYTLDKVEATVISLYADHDDYTPNKLIYSFSSLMTPYASARIRILVAQLVCGLISFMPLLPLMTPPEVCSI